MNQRFRFSTCEDMPQQITAILRILNDGGNQWAFAWTDCATGAQVQALISGGDSNIRSMVFYLNGGSWEPHSTYHYDSELGKREFNRTTKDWPYAGCHPEELAKFVRENLAAQIAGSST